MKTSALIVLVLLCFISGFSQKTNTLSGIILDAKTNEPVAFANVFLANTLIGSSSNEAGRFLLQKIPNGKYDVTITMVGYKLLSTPISFSGDSIHVSIKLTQEVIILHEVLVKAGRTDFDKYYDTFTKLFLGRTSNSNYCKIKNPEDIYLDYNEKTKVLTGTASKPIEIENRALGYRIYYVLDEFELDSEKGVFRVFGVPRFENLEPKNKAQMNRWQRSRDRAYFGSLNHFMRSLVNRQLKQNHFAIYESSSKSTSMLTEKMLFPMNDNRVFFKGDLKLVFDGESEDVGYRRGGSSRYFTPQTSILHFGEESITIYDNGYFENFKSVMLDNYLAWSESVGNLLPLVYQPGKIK